MKKLLTPQSRQELITKLVLDRGSVTVDELVQTLGVSRMTIHRDLDELEGMGVLRKVRNGATAQPSSLFESDYRYRAAVHTREKEAIGRLASTFIEPGQSVMIDDSTTLLPLVKLFPTVGSLTVITHFLPVINELSGRRGIRLIAVGGEYLPRFETFTGLICQQTIANLRADACFVSAAACKDGSIFHPEQQIANVKRTMMAQCTRKYLLLDHSKFGHVALHFLGRLDEFDCVIVDSGIAEEHLAEMYDRGVKVAVAD